MLAILPTMFALATFGAVCRFTLATDAERRRLEARANATTCSYALSGGARSVRS